MKDLLRFPFNIQMFAAEGVGGAGGENPDGDNPNETPKDIFTQADIDRAVTKAVQTADARNQKAIDDAVKAAVAEQQRLAQLSDDERKEAARVAAEQDLADKQRELDLKILRVDAGQLLVAQELPQEALELVLGNDIEATKVNVEKLKGIIAKAVEGEVKKLTTTPGTPKGQNGQTMTKEDIMKIVDRVERQKAIEANIHLFT